MDTIPAQILTPLVIASPQLAVLAIMLAGLALMFGLKRWCLRLFLFAGLLIVVGTYGVQWLP